MTEHELVHVMDTYTEYLLRIGYYYTKDLERSKDIAQDVFIALYYSGYVERGQLKAYLSRMMVNRCKDYLRSWHYRKLLLQQKFSSEPTQHVKDSLVVEEEGQILDDAILSLKMKLREVVVYYYLEGLTTKEIAVILHIPESTAKSRLQTARKKLAEVLGQYEWEELLHE